MAISVPLNSTQNMANDLGCCSFSFKTEASVSLLTIPEAMNSIQDCANDAFHVIIDIFTCPPASLPVQRRIGAEDSIYCEDKKSASA